MSQQQGPSVGSDRGRCRRYRRSRWLIGEWRGRDLLVVGGQNQRRLPADARLAELLRRLDRWTTLGDLRSEGFDIVEAEIDGLAGLGVVDVSTEDEPEVTSADGVHWSPLELMVHRSSAAGRLRDSASAVDRPELFKGRAGGPVTPLPMPPHAPEKTLAEFLSGSPIEHQGGPVRLEEVSALLHHAARVVRAGESPALGDYALRPFAGGGARSELEIYVVVETVEHLSAGTYRYVAPAHQLELIRSRDEHQAMLVASARPVGGRQLTGDASALVLVTGVFARLTWKFEGLVLLLLYEDAGCLLQTLHMVATTLGLFSCAIAVADEPTTSRWLGLDPLVESEVACLALGRGPDAGPEASAGADLVRGLGAGVEGDG